jgi:Fe-S-cluster containining protein
MKQEEPPDIECLQCGICCKVFGDSISPTVENLYRWLENERSDILKHFSACMPDGSWIACSHLRVGELHDVVSIELRDPETGGYASVCPFLLRISKQKYICAIHSEKPEMCNNYKPWIWGETYYRRCRAIAMKEQSSFWNR